MSDEYYKTLGVSKSATKDEISAAYRKLARKYHPDLNQDDPKKAKEQFQKIQEAYDVLGNEEKRKVYNQFGVSPDQMGNGGGQGPFQWSFGGSGGRRGNFNFGNLGDIFEMFGGGQGFGGAPPDGFAHAGRSGQDIEMSITIPFVQAVTGGKTELRIKRPEGGEETVSVNIPAGIEDGKKIRLPGLGTQGRNGGKSGNMYIAVHIEPHPYYSRKGNNLYVKLPITLKEAVFGTKVDVPTPKGSVALTIPAGSTSGTKLRMKGHGISSGDLFAELLVVLPKHWSKDDKELLEKLSADHSADCRGDLQWG